MAGVELRKAARARCRDESVRLSLHVFDRRMVYVEAEKLVYSMAKVPASDHHFEEVVGACVDGGMGTFLLR
jgi:hypothetical protein